MSRYVQALEAIDPALKEEPLTHGIAALLELPVGLSSTGYPYLHRRAWEIMRDTIPHLFAMGQRVIDAMARVERALETGADAELAERAKLIGRVVRQIVRTAAITAPPDLWLIKHVTGNLAGLGLTDRLIRGEAIYPSHCEVDGVLLDEEQLEADLTFLLSRGYVEQYDEGFRVAGHPRAIDVLRRARARRADLPSSLTTWWRALTAGESLDEQHARVMNEALAVVPPPRAQAAQTHWIATHDEIALGALIVPLVLGMRAAELTGALGKPGAPIEASQIAPRHVDLEQRGIEILASAGWIEPGDDGSQSWRTTALGARGFGRGPGPFGIIETYHPYMSRGQEILRRGRRDVWVARGENVGASQDANRKTFRMANDSLDRFCAETGFEYSVFIEHAIGRGEATRQRAERDGMQGRQFVGADLEDAAIDAAVVEQGRGKLPKNMIFVRDADIGKPERLLDALREHDLSPCGAVMIVGNGFHEVRDQSDERMVEVFRGYHDAGVVILFTEENALSIDDLRATAWNTYHAGFRYVHEKSGQCLRPSDPRPPVKLGKPLRAAWSECAGRAGYVRLVEYGSKTRTIYPTTPPSGHNPSISVNHFFVPRPIAQQLGVVPDGSDEREG